MIVGITGGIGSGKSTVVSIFAVLGVPVYNADAATRALMHTNEPLKQALQNQFGAALYINNVLQRKYLANIVFNNKKQLEILNSIVHPYSIAHSIQWATEQQAPYVIKEAALLFETEAFHYVDYIVGVAAPLALKLQRVMHRDACTQAEVLERMQWQMDDCIKMKLCNAVINNNEQQLIVPQVLHLHSIISALV